MAEVTLKSFLDGDSQVQAARKKAKAAEAELNKQKSALVQAGTRATAALTEQINKRIETAQANFNSAQDNLKSVEATRSSYFEKNKKKIRAEAGAKEVSQAKQELQEVMSLMQTQPGNAILEARAADLKERIAGTGKYAPKPKEKVTDATPGDQAETAAARNYQQEITGAVAIVRAMSPKERQNLAEVLKAANFYQGPIVGVYTDALVESYKQAIAANNARTLSWGEEVPWSQFIQDKINETNVLKGAGGKGAVPTGTVSISTPTEAAAKVEARFQATLGRLPTAEELRFYSDKLIAEEKKKSSITKGTQKKIGGVVVTEYTGGLDRDQFLDALIRKLPEFTEAKSAKRNLTLQDLNRTALSNGLNLSKNFGPDIVAGWVKRVENGEDIDIFKNLIRQTASIGLPDNLVKLVDSGVDLDAVYSPYRRLMASTFQLPENSISLDDATLRSAIGPEKPMTLFDFQKQLRKDARWQFTDQAREEVSDAALRVLRDFGFQG